jgi:hypothetical protein
MRNGAWQRGRDQGGKDSFSLVKSLPWFHWVTTK